MSVGEKDKKLVTKRKIETSSVAEPSSVKKPRKTDSKDVKPKKTFGKSPTKPFKKFPGAKTHVQKPLEKQNWNELKKKKKDLKVQRKKERFSDEKLYEVDLTAKKIYEKLKR